MNPAIKLSQAAVDAFSRENEVHKIYTFGSINTGKSDAYSDVDLTVVSYDPAHTCARLTHTLSSIGAAEAVYVIFETRDSAAYTVMLDSQSPFQKIDLGIVGAVRPLEMFENSKCVYSSTKLLKAGNKPIRSLGISETDNQLLDCLLGSVRYLKHVHRGETWSAYKFYRGFMDQYMRLDIGIDDSRKLSLEDFKALDARRKFPTDMIFNASQAEMHATFITYLEKYVEAFSEKVDISKQCNNYAHKIVGFWHEQIERIS